jgi:UDP-glucose 4-epimerase
MPTYLVTGGAGFIGSNIVERLLKDNQSVRVLDNYSTGRKENLEAFKDRIEIMEGDIRDLEVCRKAVRDVQYVLHQAALASVPRSVEDPIASNDANIGGTLNMLVAARDAGVERLVFAASSSAYGDTPTLPKEESMTPQPLSPYAINKLVGEHYCRVFFQLYGFQAVALRYFNVFGPRQDPKSQYAAVIPLFVTALMEGRAPVIFGDGEQSRDFTFVDNVVQANLLAAQTPQAAGEVINVACADRLTLNELAAVLKELLGSDIEFQYEDPRPGDIKHSWADISKARRILGFEPQLSVRDGLKKTVAWYQNQA